LFVLSLNAEDNIPAKLYGEILESSAMFASSVVFGGFMRKWPGTGVGQVIIRVMTGIGTSNEVVRAQLFTSARSFASIDILGNLDDRRSFPKFRAPDPAVYTTSDFQRSLLKLAHILQH